MPNAVDSPCRFATVKMAHIDLLSDEELTFSSRSSVDDYESFTVSMNEVLLDPPTDAPTPVELAPGSIGYLYLSEDGWRTRSRAGSTLYKANDENYVLIKWPICRPYRILSFLRVTPRRILVDGVNLANGMRITIDLLGPEAAPAQDIDWRAAAPIVVKLTTSGAAANGGMDVRMIWPKRILVEGASLQKPHRIATVDILDVAYGDFNQRLTWSERGEPVNLKLSTTGFARFKVVPTPLAHLAAGRRVTYPEDVVRECSQLDDVDDDDVRECVALARARVGPARADVNKGGGSSST